jgi:hypothetical protein
MTTPESRRHDLYNGLTELLGEDRADTLMTYLPSSEGTDLATKSDLDAIEDRLVVRIDIVSQRLEGLSQRLDRMVLAMIAGLVAIIATLVAQSFI